MKDSIIFLCAVILVSPCIVYAIVQRVKDMNPKSLNENVKNILSSNSKRLVDLNQKDYHKKHNWKRMILFAIIFLLVMVIFIWIPALSAQADVLQYLAGGLLVYMVIVIILFVLTLRDNSKLLDNKDVYIIKGYLKNVYIYHGTRVVLVYYDYIQQKYVIKKTMLNTNEIRHQIIEKNRYVDILVQENTKKLRYISLET